MNKVMRVSLSVLVSILLLSALTMAKSADKNTTKAKEKEHHSRIAKAAFWRHHKSSTQKGKSASASREEAKPAQTKAAQLKPASAKQATPKASVKKAPVSKKEKPAAKQGEARQHTQKLSSPAKKESTATKAKQGKQVAKAKAVALKQ